MPAVDWRTSAGDAPAALIDETQAGERAKAPPGERWLRYLFNHDQDGARRGFYKARSIVMKLYGAEEGSTVPTHLDKYGPGLKAFAVLNLGPPPTVTHALETIVSGVSHTLPLIS